MVIVIDVRPNAKTEQVDMACHGGVLMEVCGIMNRYIPQ